MPGVGMWPPSRYMASMASVNKIRLRRSGILKIFVTASKNFIFDYLNTSTSAPSRSRLGNTNLGLAPNYGSTSAGLLDLLQSRFREHMRLHGDLASEIARSQHFQPRAQLLDDAQLQQPARIELVAFQLLQAPYIYDRVFFPKYVVEAAFRKAPVQRHLAALKPAHNAVAGNGPGALRAPAGV